MRVKHGLELRQLGPKSFILEMTSEYKGETSKMITFNSTAAFLWESVKDKDFSRKICVICYRINSLFRRKLRWRIPRVLLTHGNKLL